MPVARAHGPQSCRDSFIVTPFLLLNVICPLRCSKGDCCTWIFFSSLQGVILWCTGYIMELCSHSRGCDRIEVRMTYWAHAVFHNIRLCRLVALNDNAWLSLSFWKMYSWWIICILFKLSVHVGFIQGCRQDFQTLGSWWGEISTPPPLSYCLICGEMKAESSAAPCKRMWNKMEEKLITIFTMSI